MPNAPQVVDGDASESDSKIEIVKTDGEIPAETAETNEQVSVKSEEEELDEEERLSPPLKRVCPPPRTSPNPQKMLYHQICEVLMPSNVLGFQTRMAEIEEMASLYREVLDLQESIFVNENKVALARAHVKTLQEEKKNCHLERNSLPTPNGTSV